MLGTKLLLMFRLSVRNVLRQVRRSLLTASAMALGLALTIFSRSIADGAHEDWINSGVRLGSGHLTLQHSDYQRSHRLEDRIPLELWGVANEEPVSGRAEVLAVAPRLVVAGLANGATGGLPVEIMAVDPEGEARFSMLPEKVVEGRYLTRDDGLHAFVGDALARRLGVRLGSRLVLTAQDANSDIVAQLVRVAGIFHSGIPEVDEGVVHIPLATAQRWLDVGDDITGLAVQLATSRDVGAMAVHLEEAVGTEALALHGARVLDWRETMPELAAAVRIDDYGDYIVRTILFIIVALAIVNTVLMSVLQRVREFGVMQALGLTPSQTGAVVFLEGVLLSILSGVVGVVLGLAFTWFFFRDGLDFSAFMENDLTMSGIVVDTVIIPEFRVGLIVQSALVIFGIGLVASLYPAYRASRIDVAEAMKFER